MNFSHLLLCIPIWKLENMYFITPCQVTRRLAIAGQEHLWPYLGLVSWCVCNSILGRVHAGRQKFYIHLHLSKVYIMVYLGLNPSPNQWGVCKSRVFAKVNTDHKCINWNSAVSSQSFHCSLIITRSCEVLTWDVLVLIYIHAHLCRK